MISNSLNDAVRTVSSTDSPDQQQSTSDSYQRLTRALSTFRRYSSGSETPADWLNANLVQVEQILKSNLCHADFTEAQTRIIGNILYQVGDPPWRYLEHEIFTVPEAPYIHV